MGVNSLINCKQHWSQTCSGVNIGGVGWTFDGQYTGAGGASIGAAALECHVNTSALPSSTIKPVKS